jgi:hypothetical protein
MALFGDFFRNLLNPIRVKISLPKQSDNVVNQRGKGREYAGKYTYCQHLCVENLTPDRPIVNCRVWLESISAESEAPQFAVPRLMNWAPSEWSNDQRTFSCEDVFDLGETIEGDVGFELSWNANIGGNLDRVVKTTQKWRVCLYVTADNYLKRKLFYFEISVPSSTGTGKGVGDEAKHAKVSVVQGHFSRQPAAQ